MRTTCVNCGKQFSKPTRKQAELALRMHVGRVHGNIRVPSEGNSVKRGATQTSPVTNEDPELRRRRRLDYQRKYRLQKRRQRVVSNGQVTMCFCPRCGMNLEVLATALAVVNKA